jgi:hypothetical protein
VAIFPTYLFSHLNALLEVQVYFLLTRLSPET